MLSGFQNRVPFYKSWGVAVTDMAKQSALKHSKGGKFWRSIADKTRLIRVDNNGAEIVCLDPAGAHKEKGGTVRNKIAGALTIPLKSAPEAKGKRASDFTLAGYDLFVVKGTLGYSDLAGFHGLFALRKSVTHKKEPWFPTEKQAEAVGIPLAEFWLKRISGGLAK
jgi:hypothetical protein